MRKFKQILTAALSFALAASFLYVPAFAITESEVEAIIAESSKEAVAGNVLIWFLCAVAFLKVSLKIDSFMASLGVNAGHTGGSMLADAMVTFRAATMAAGGANRIFGGRHGAGTAKSGGSTGGGSGFAGPGSFFKGGLIGMAGRHITNSAVKTATTQTSAVHTAQKQGGAAVHTATEKTSTAEVHAGSAVHSERTSRTDSHTARNSSNQEGVIITGQDAPSAEPGPAGSTIPTDITPALDNGIPSSSEPQQEGTILTGGEPPSSRVTQSEREHMAHSSSEKAHSETTRQGGASERHTVSQFRNAESIHRSTHSTSPTRMPTLGGKIFSHSLQSGGQFANDVIGKVACGDMRSTGSITGDLAAQSLQSYMGHTALGTNNTEKVSYSQVEIGGGRITGREVTPEHPQGIEFAMYHAGQYTRPEGDYQKVFSADGAAWYKQHAVDTVAKTPFKAPDGEVGYQKEIVKRLPTPPKRKDHM